MLLTERLILLVAGIGTHTITYDIYRWQTVVCNSATTDVVVNALTSGKRKRWTISASMM